MRLTKAQDAYNKAVESMQPQNEALNKQVTEAKREMDALEAEHAEHRSKRRPPTIPRRTMS